MERLIFIASGDHPFPIKPELRVSLESSIRQHLKAYGLQNVLVTDGDMRDEMPSDYGVTAGWERCALFANRSQKLNPKGADWAYNQACIDIERLIREAGRNAR